MSYTKAYPKGNKKACEKKKSLTFALGFYRFYRCRKSLLFDHLDCFYSIIGGYFYKVNPFCIAAII